MILLKLFWEFFKTGLFAVGGGMATIPFLTAISEKTQWFTMNELANMIAVAESTPGPIGVNMATYVGFTTYGIVGALTATLGLALPSLLIILIVARFMEKFRNSPIVDNAFKYLRPVVVGLIAYALYVLSKITFIRDGSISWINLAGFALIFVCTKLFSKVHPIIWVFIGAVFGILFL